MNSVQLKIAEKISTIAPAVEDKIITSLVDRELNRRSDAVVKAIDALSKMEAEMKKIKPENTFDAKGEKISEYFTKAKIEEKNKLQQKIDKYTKAIEKALEKADYGDVYNLEKSGGDPKPSGDTDQSEAA